MPLCTIYIPRKGRGKGLRGKKTPVCVSVGDGREGEKRQRRESNTCHRSHTFQKSGGVSSSPRSLFSYFLLFFRVRLLLLLFFRQPRPSARPPARPRRRRSGLFPRGSAGTAPPEGTEPSPTPREAEDEAGWVGEKWGGEGIATELEKRGWKGGVRERGKGKRRVFSIPRFFSFPLPVQALEGWDGLGRCAWAMENRVFPSRLPPPPSFSHTVRSRERRAPPSSSPPHRS